MAAVAAATALAITGPAYAQLPLTGSLLTHDPSTLVKDGNTYRYFATGTNISAKRSTNLINWQSSSSVFSSPPAWTTQAVPLFDGNFWAPDITYVDGEYHLYYSVSSWGSQVSAIGLVTNPTLNPSDPNYAWTDRGPVIQSTNTNPSGFDDYNAIDPGIFQDVDNGTMWMTFGSFWDGIFITQLDPSTGMRLNPGTAPTRLASKSGTDVEASSMYKHDGYYYLFLNWGSCCNGTSSTYNIRVGRGLSPTGPFVDKNGTNLLIGGGSLFLGSEGSRIGPGHMGIYAENEVEFFSYHYYDANNSGLGTYGLNYLYWDTAGWPTATPINSNWTGNLNGNWGSGSNWSSSLPDGSGHTANFGSISSGQFNVTLDVDDKTAGVVNFDNTTSYTIGYNAGNSLIMQSTGAAASINVITGSHTIAAPVTLNDNLNLSVTDPNGMLTMSGELTANGRTINKIGTGTAQFENVRNAALNVNAGTLKMSPKAGPNDPAGTSVVSSLFVATGASLDLTNNSLVINYDGAVGTLEEDVRAMMLTGKIISGAAGTPAGTKLGYGDNGALGKSELAGQTVDASSMLVMFTLSGDANLDGLVTIADLGELASNWQSTTAVWRQGDFNYDGQVTIADLGDLASNWQGGVGGMSFEAALAAVGLGGATVPEPVAAGVAALGASLLLARRSRRKMKQ